MKRILLTAFEPFGGETVNPSLEAATQMRGVEFSGGLVRVAELPVDRFRGIELAEETILAVQPDAVVMLGEAGGRFRVNPERVAINVDDFRIADNSGNQPAGEPIVEGGPDGYFSTLPIRAIRDRLIEARIPAEISNSAGTFLCNRLFYRVMHLINTRSLPIMAGFVHLPYLHEQVVAKRQDFPSFSRETVVEAVRLTIEVTLENCAAQ